MDTADKIGVAVLVLFVFIFVSVLVLLIADGQADGIAKDACRANGYTSGFSHLWTGDVFCVIQTEPVIYSFPKGTEITHLKPTEP